MTDFEQALSTAVQQLYNIQKAPIISRTDAQFGDFTSNVAMQLAKDVQQSPREIAQAIVEYLQAQQYDWLQNITIAGPGFINVQLQDTALAALWSLSVPQLHAGKRVTVEYSDPNPFKALHAGHLYTTLVGNTIAELIEQSGAETFRLNYGGDVGLHVAKAMFGIIGNLGGLYPKKLLEITPNARAKWLSQRYTEGNDAYESDELSKQEIIAINKRVYDVHESGDTSSEFAQIYWTCRQWSYDGFVQLYDELSVTPFNEYIPESTVTPLGISLVRSGLKKGIFVESEGAVVFDGEARGLHTRVFINSNNIPTYEAKELGLAEYKWRQYAFDKSIVITGNDIVEYMKVLLMAIAEFEPNISNRTTHLTHGMIKLSGGQKMSSRKGNVLMADDIIKAAKQANTELSGNTDDAVAIGAIKYAFLRQRMGGDIIYDPMESISLQGNSGPYLQYAHARARSILQKSAVVTAANLHDFTPEERLLVVALADYQTVLTKAITELMPHHICTYLYELAQVFNRFYESSKVIGDEREAIRLVLVKRYADTLKAGLSLLGITAPDKM